MNKLAILLCAALAPLLSGCVALAAGAAGAMIATDVLENQTYVAQFNMDADELWHSAKATVSHSSTDPIEVDRDLRTVRAKIDGAVVVVSVETFDLNQSLLRVEAKKYGMVNGEIANMVLQSIVDDLDETQQGSL